MMTATKTVMIPVDADPDVTSCRHDVPLAQCPRVHAQRMGASARFLHAHSLAYATDRAGCDLETAQAYADHTTSVFLSRVCGGDSESDAMDMTHSVDLPRWLAERPGA